MTTRSRKPRPHQSEGNVYLCSWEKRGRKFNICLKKDPTVVAQGESFEVAQEKMWELLCERFGDGEAVVEYDRPLPMSEISKKYGSPEILIVSGNDSVGNLAGNLRLFSGGYCAECDKPLGQRTDQPAQFDSLPNSDGACPFNGNVGPMFSDRFLSLLSASEKSGMRFLPVLGPSSSSKNFHELVGEALVNFVGVPSFPGLGSVRCKQCNGFGRFTYLHPDGLFQFIALEDLPKPLPSVFVVGDVMGVKLCMTRDRYQAIIGKKGTSQICSRQLWVVPDDRFVRVPEDEDYPEALRWKPRSGKIKVVG